MLVIPPMRGVDVHGSGAYLASRGNRMHNGIDYACYAGSQVLACKAGEVTKIGYPYNPTDQKKGHLRYVEVTDSDGHRGRYFYIDSAVKRGDVVEAGDLLGITQGLLDIYPGITDHFHFEIKTNDGYIDPANYGIHG